MAYSEPAPKVINAVAEWLSKYNLHIWGPCCFCKDTTITGARWSNDNERKVRGCEKEKRLHCDIHHASQCGSSWGSW